MPGAPNRPPETSTPAPAPIAADPPERKVLRRLVPSHVALLLDSWKGPLGPEVLGPFEKAEAAYAAGDFGTATTQLDLLSIRFAEPRWPSLPEPFRRLRVAIPAPVPPHWDPDHALPAPEKDARRARRTADDQFALAEGSVAWAASHGLATSAIAPDLEAARAQLSSNGLDPSFYAHLDALWSALRPQLPRPKAAGRVAAPAAAAEATE